MQQPQSKPQMDRARMDPEKKTGNHEQDLYDIFVAQGIKLAAETAKGLTGKASVNALGHTLFMIVRKVEGEGQRHGINFPLSVLLHGSNEILGHIIEMSGVKISDDQIKATIGIAVGEYFQDAIKSGRMKPEQLANLARQAQQSAASMQQGPGAQGRGQMGDKGLLAQQASNGGPNGLG